MNTVYVLLEYSLDEQRLVGQREFLKSDEAHAAYFAMEREHFLDPSVEIVLLASDSLETIRRTHGSYFADEMDETISRLKDLLPALQR